MQTKLTIGRPGDRYELEADRVASEVLRMPEPGRARERGPLSVSSLGSGAAVQRMCTECSEELEDVAQTKAAMEPVTAAATPQRAELPSAGGQPLSGPVRSFFESRFGRDFGRVRIHAGPQAAQSARALNARAYTVGPNVVFGPGQFAPHTESGRFLLAHELTHTVQQGAAAEDRVVQRMPLVRVAERAQFGLLQRNEEGTDGVDSCVRDCHRAFDRCLRYPGRPSVLRPHECLARLNACLRSCQRR